MLNFDNKKAGQTAFIIRKRWIKKIFGENKLSMRERKRFYWKVTKLFQCEKVRHERRQFLFNGEVHLTEMMETNTIDAIDTYYYLPNNGVVTSISKSGSLGVSTRSNGTVDCTVSVNSIGSIDSIGSVNSIDSIGSIDSGVCGVSDVVLEREKCKLAVDYNYTTSDSVLVSDSLDSATNILTKNALRKNQVMFMGYNVRTLAECTSYESVTNTLKSEKLQEIVEAMNLAGIMCCALMEVRRKGSGVISLDFGYSFYYSGGKEKCRGVGFIVKNCLLNDMSVINVSDRIMFITGSIGSLQVSFASLYAPTHGNGDEESMRLKEQFFDDVSEAYGKLPLCFRVNSMMFIDSNSHIGSYSLAQKKIRGPFVGEGQITNKSGEFLFNFCAKNDVVIGNTYFKMDEYWTWEMPGTCVDDERLSRRFTIDFCLVSKSLQHLMLFCGRNDNIDIHTTEASDHLPIFLEMNFEMVLDIQSKPKLSNSRLKVNYDYGVLRSKQVRDIFQVKCTEYKMNDVSNINQFNSIISAVRQEVISIKEKRKFKSWMKGHELEIKKLIFERRMIRQSWLQFGKNTGPWKDLYVFSKKFCRQRLRKIKNNFFVKRSINIQKSFDAHNSKQFFRSIHDFVPTPPVLIPDKIFFKGNKLLTSTTKERSDRIIEHFKDLLNQPSVIRDNVKQFLPKEEKIVWALQDPFTIKELDVAICQMSRDKSCGPDNIPIEILQSLGPSVIWNKLLMLFNEYLELGMVPNELKDVVISPIFKKDDRRSMDNYRGISLISHHGKLLEKLVNNRLTSVAESLNWLPESQNGFRENRSTVHSIFVSRMLASLCREKGVQLSKVYIDFVKAYDKVNQELLWVVLAKRGVPPKLIRLIRAFHEGSKASVKIDGVLSEVFELTMGLKQGSIIAPLLFNIFIGSMIEAIDRRVNKLGLKLKFKIDSNIFEVTKLSKNTSGAVSDITIWDILFADDAEIVSDSPENLKMIIDIFSMVATAYGQEISIKKSEVMFLNPKDGVIDSTNYDMIQVYGQNLKVVKEFKYLGALETNTADCSLEIQSRIQKAIVSFEMNKAAVFDNPYINRFVALSMYKVLVITVLLYGCESWAISSKDIKELERFQYRTIKAILKISTRQRISHTNILMLARCHGVEIFPVEIVLRRRRLIFLGQIECSGPSNMCYQLLHSDVMEGARCKGNVINYRSSIKDDMKKFDISADEWSYLVKRPKEWIAAIDRGFSLYFRNWIHSNMSLTVLEEGELTNEDGSINTRGLKLREQAEDKLKEVLFSLRYFIYPTADELSSRLTIGNRRVRYRGFLDSNTNELIEDLASISELQVVEELAQENLVVS